MTRCRLAGSSESGSLSEPCPPPPPHAQLEEGAFAGSMRYRDCARSRTSRKRLHSEPKPKQQLEVEDMRAPLSTFALVSLAGLSLACVQPGPVLSPAPASAREMKAVAAPFGRTWDAVIERFAEDNIPIRTLKRASGFVATESMTVPASMNEEADWADCGTAPFIGRLYPTAASYNILVRGDGARSSVKASVRWTTAVRSDASTSTRECTTTGNWEAAVEEGIAARAEGRERRDVPLRSLLPCADTIPLVVADQYGAHWTIRPVSGPTGTRGFEFWGPDGEVRFVAGTIPNWRWLSATEWHRAIAGAPLVIRKKQSPPRKGAGSRG